MKKVKAFTVSTPLTIIALVVLICVGAYLAYAITVANKNNNGSSVITDPKTVNTSTLNETSQTEESVSSNTSEQVNQSDKVESNTSPTAADETSDQKTYSNADYSFKYPLDWTLSSDASGVTLDTPGVKASDHFDNDRPYAITVTNTSLSKLDVQDLGITSLKDYLDKYSSLSDPVIKNVTSLKIGDTNGYRAEAGPNQFGGGNYYYVETNNKVVQIWVFVRTQDTAVNQILSTFEFAK